MHVVGRALSLAFALAVLVVSPLAVAEFAPTSDMSLGQGGRYGAFAARLPDGKVLYAGGFNGGNLASGQIYDPVTGTYSASANSLSAARGFGRAVTLQDGSILLVGGGNYDESGAVANADIYDPATGMFAATGSMHTARAAFMAVRLQDGKVLVAGGADGATRLDSAELYDPASGQFTVTGSLLVARNNGVAALLPNGKVLITGGGRGDGVSRSEAELYDPATGAFTVTGSMNDGRDDATATLLPNGKVLVAGGANFDVPLGTAEVYDPATGTFTPSAATMPPRDFASAVMLPNNLVLIAGGQGDTQGLGDTGALDDGVIYDYQNDTFTSAGRMANARFYTPAVLLDDGRVLIAGGYNNDGVVSGSELYSYSFVDEIFVDGFDGP